MEKKPFLARFIPCYIDVFRHTAIREKRFTCVWRAYDWFPGFVPRHGSGDVRVYNVYRVKLKKKTKVLWRDDFGGFSPPPFRLSRVSSCYPSLRSRHDPCSPSLRSRDFPAKISHYTYRRHACFPRKLNARTTPSNFCRYTINAIRTYIMIINIVVTIHLSIARHNRDTTRNATELRGGVRDNADKASIFF